MPVKKKWLTGLAVLLIVSGVLLLLKEPIQNYLIKQMVNQNQVTTVTAEVIRENEQVEAEFDFDQTVSVNWEQVLAGYQNRTDLPVIGGMAIPSIELQLPILKGLSNENLIAGAGTMTPDQVMGEGNYALVSHNVVRPGVLFSDVQYMSIGDLIYLTDLENIYIYEVNRLEMISPTQVEVVEDVPGKQIVTLVTCSNDILMRWVCQGDLREIVPLAEATPEMAEILELE